MMVKIALILELLSIMICLHQIYEEKIKVDISTILFLMLSIIVLDIINSYQIDEIWKLFIYLMIYIYIKYEFKQSFKNTIWGIFLLAILMIIMQFMCILFTSLIIKDDEILRTLYVNIEVLVCNIFVLPICKVNALKKHFQVKNKYSVMLVVFILTIIIILLLQDKVYKGIRLDWFILFIPTVIFVLYFFSKFCKSQTTINKMREEKDISIEMQNYYDELLKRVRINQHHFKNHISAILSSHYMYKTYDQLVQAQNEYCNIIIQENKYNELLLLEDKIFVGFLFNKFQEIEKANINLVYKICANIREKRISTYSFIEIVGILIDNAIEADYDIDKKSICIEIFEDKNMCYFSIQNIHKYVSYSEIEQWFQMGTSSKGINRGIGLYYVKKLCQDNNCNLRCENETIEEMNWIRFILEIEKAVI